MHLLVFLEEPHRCGVNLRGLGIEDDCRNVETGLIALRLLTELFGLTAKYVRGLEPGKCGAEYSVEYAELVPAVATGV
jgi:hypothetical protein